MEAILFIYFKEGKIKALDFGHGKNEHTKMIDDGWKHTSTINASLFAEKLFSEVNSPDLRTLVVDSLIGDTIKDF